MKKAFIIFLAILIISNSGVTSFAQTKEEPQLKAEAAVLIDASTGDVLYDKNMDKRMYPASTTKIITALLALENLDLSSVVTIDNETSLTEGSRIHLIEGEKVTVEQLLYALLLKSANDSAIALAKAVAGDVPSFAKMMNAKAKELGANNTNFVTPNGLPNGNHYTTAYDLAMITKVAMKNDEFRKMITTLRYTIPKTNKSDARKLRNPNKLLYGKSKYKGVTGIKTGYTNAAGGCLVAGAKRGNLELISVALKSTTEGRFEDSKILLDYGFQSYKRVLAIKKGEPLGEIRVSRGEIRKVEIVAANSSYLTIPRGDSEAKINTKILIDEKVRAPVNKGENVGSVEIYNDDVLVDEVDAVTFEKVDEGGFLSIIGTSDKVADVLKILLVIIIAGVIVFYIKRK